MAVTLIVVGVAVIGFVAGILVGRNNRTRVEDTVKAVKGK
jgi:hypothetical protein